MTLQATNTKEGGLTSCHGCTQKLWAFTQKELETLSVVQNLLGALTNGGGSACARGVVDENVYENSTKNRWFLTLIYLKTIKNAFFNKKLLDRTYIKDFFRGIDEF